MRLGLAVAGLASFAAIVSFAALLSGAPTTATPGAPTARPRYTAAPGPSAERTDARGRPRVGPFVMPLAGHEVPGGPEFLPEALREYRAGIHEGIDFPAHPGTPVLAAADGRIVRIDQGFTDWTAAERAAALEAARAIGHTPAPTLDRIRGRQVWIDHGHGVVTRYAHLSDVAPLQPGTAVTAGTVVGAVGSSGYPEGGSHLHFEIRIGDGYLGDGLGPEQLADALRRAFR